MKEKIITLFGIAFIVAVIATGVFYGLVVARVKAPAESAGEQQVVVAAKPIDRGAVLAKADLKAVPWTGKELPQGAVTRVDQLVGATLLEGVGPNDPVTEARVITPKAIPSGMRVISVHATDSSGVVAMLRPSHRVDVQVIVNNSRGEQSIRTILQSVEVLSVSTSEATKPVVNLLVAPEEADVLGLADTVARVRLLLRNGSDSGRPTSTQYPVSQLLSSTPNHGRADNKMSGFLATAKN
ncbi:MAG TPA: Flp pilus assembly protein CpaB [Bryobacteraceae bacterium]|jgi:pilus assembly protein CpaB|nr:Flp pilus assembly protein CpaB [Bryobacteraceae bacterium]